MGTSSGLAFTSEEELKRRKMIIVTFVSVVLLISGSIAQFQGGKCPNTPDCVLKGGECFPKRCPRGFEKIGPCLRTGCVCCRPDPVGQCPASKECAEKGGECFPKDVQFARLKTENAEKFLQKLGNVNPGDNLPAHAAACTIENNNLQEEIHQFTNS